VEVVLALDRLDEPTLEWFHGQRRVLAAGGVVEPMPETPADSLAFLTAREETVATAEGEPVAILHRWLGPLGESLEQTLIDVGAIRAVGVRR
jgi:hypothetical protein